MPSNLLRVADACKATIESIVLPVFPNAEVRQTFFYERFDAENEVGLKVYVWAFAEASGSIALAGDRSTQPRNYKLGFSMAERIPSTVETFDDKDAWLKQRIEVAIAVRDFFDSPYAFKLPGLEDLYFIPTDVGELETADLDFLHRIGVFSTGCDLTIREDVT